jgi:hypothetical protein
MQTPGRAASAAVPGSLAASAAGNTDQPRPANAVQGPPTAGRIWAYAPLWKGGPCQYSSGKGFRP